MSQKLTTPEIKIIRDPIYGDIKISHPVLIALIQTAEFNRLRSIFQTPSVSPIFPGATCTRFLHCLGALHLVQKILNSPTFIKRISLSDQLKVKIAALLHDIGHGPLSHTFEEINYLPGVSFHHEKNAHRFLTDSNSEIYKILYQTFQNQRDIEDIFKMINGTSKHPLAVLVNSQADTDRMDYLMRDNWFAGTGYGYVDSQFLVRNIHFDHYKNVVYFSEKAVFSLENYLIGRYHMHTQVYSHLVSRGFNLLFRQIMARILDLSHLPKYLFSNNKIKILTDLFKQKINYFDLLKLDDYFLTDLLVHLTEEKDSILQHLGYAWKKRMFFVPITGTAEQKKILSKIKTKFGSQAHLYFSLIISNPLTKPIVIYDEKKHKPIYIQNTKTKLITPFSQYSKLIPPLMKLTPATTKNQQQMFALKQIFN